MKKIFVALLYSQILFADSGIPVDEDEVLDYQEIIFDADEDFEEEIENEGEISHQP